MAGGSVGPALGAGPAFDSGAGLLSCELLRKIPLFTAVSDEGAGAAAAACCVLLAAVAASVAATSVGAVSEATAGAAAGAACWRL
mmetsp:Transcript_51125/g.111082  ORF Transcript_51125/g.111082 Transcript_51125/m.111082 type:complete len:85 (+) Transcript_51125:309-563(+)